jgi:hypothetical protein
VIAAALAAGLALAAQDVEVRFAPAVGLALSKTLLVRHELSLVEMGSTREGSPLMREEVGGWMMAGTRLSWTDEYLRVAAGRPELFRRTLKRFEGNARITVTGNRSAKESSRAVSPLAGLPVLHTWVPEEGTWGRCYDDLAGDEELLEALDDDGDFLGLLPPGPVAVGATWPAQPNALKSLFAPCGNTAAKPSEGGFFQRLVELGIGGDLADVLDRDLAGTVDVTLVELREVEGRRLAVLNAVFSVSSERDRTRTYLEGMPKEERREPSELQRAILTWFADGTAEILWDLEAGHTAGASAEANQTFTAEVFKASSAEGGVPVNISQRTTYNGLLAIDLNVREGTEAGAEAEQQAAEFLPGAETDAAAAEQPAGKKKKPKNSE